MNKKYRLHEKAWQNKLAWKLVNENWTIAHEIIGLRDGYKCTIPNCYNEDLQLDHVISRKCKRLFFEMDNLNYLCASHHGNKSFRSGEYIDNIVREMCRQRVGVKRFEEMIQESNKTLGEFKTVLYQEQINIKLKEMKAMYLSREDEVKRA